MFWAIYKFQLTWIEKNNATNAVPSTGQASWPHSVMSPLSHVCSLLKWEGVLLAFPALSLTHCISLARSIGPGEAGSQQATHTTAQNTVTEAWGYVKDIALDTYACCENRTR